MLSWAGLASSCRTSTRCAHTNPSLEHGLALSPCPFCHRRRLVGAAAAGLQAAAVHIFVNCSQFGLPGEPRWGFHTTRLFAALLYYGSPFKALLAAATLLALMLHSDPVHARAAELLSARWLAAPARLSYGLYLVAEQARFWGMLLLLPAGMLPALIDGAPAAGLAVFWAFSMCAGYAGAALLHVLVERRF